MRLLRAAVASALVAVTAAVTARAAAAQATVFTFNALPTATAAGALGASGGYTFTNVSTLEATSTFGTGANAVGGAGRFAYVPLGQTFGSIRRDVTNFNLYNAFLSFRAFDGNLAPVSVTVNAYRGFDLSAPAVFTRTVALTNAAQRVDFDWNDVTEVEFLTGTLTANGRAAVVAFDDLSVAVVPEPATVALVGAGVVVLVGAARRRRPA